MAQIAESQTRTSFEPPSRDIYRLAAESYSSASSLTTLAVAAPGPECPPLAIVAEGAMIAAEPGLRSSVHVGNGSWGEVGPVGKLYEHGWLSGSITWVHCNSLGDSELDLIASSGEASRSRQSSSSHGPRQTEHATVRRSQPAAESVG